MSGETTLSGVSTAREVAVRMPRLGESVTEATITRWLKEEGERVEMDEPLVEIATDKVDSEVPAPQTGILKKKLFKEGDVVPVGEVFAILEVEGAGSEAETETETETETAEITEASPPEKGVPSIPPEDGKEQGTREETEVVQPSPSVEVSGDGERTGRSTFFSPVVLRIAQEHGISMEELSQIPGTGLGGRVTKKDVLRYIEQRKQKREERQEKPGPQLTPGPGERPRKEEVPASPPPPVLESVPVSAHTEGPVEIVEMDRVRRLIAEHMIQSKRTSAHVTSFAEADVTGLVRWRERWKKVFEEREGFNLTYTPIFVELLVQALKEFPRLNASVEGNRIILKKYYNIGIAVALPDGNLIVPVVKNADQYNLVGLARKIYDLAERARKKQLKPDEIEGGTFTLTNIGSFGSLMGTPIIHQPQVAILATGAIKKRVVVVETEAGDTIAIRHMMYVSLSYDHRIIDGALAGSFLKRFVELLENFDTERTL